MSKKKSGIHPAALALAALLCGAALSPSFAQTDTKARPVRPKEVSVHVLMLSDQLSRNPEEYIEAGGSRYIYFNSPRLAAPARPLAEPRPRYPRGKLEQKDGAVILQLLIDERGELHQASVVCAARGYEKSALDSVKGLKFQPARGKDGPVRSYMLVEFGYGRGFPCIPAPFY